MAVDIDEGSRGIGRELSTTALSSGFESTFAGTATLSVNMWRRIRNLALSY